MIEFIKFAPLGFVVLIVSLFVCLLVINFWEARKLDKFNKENNLNA